MDEIEIALNKLKNTSELTYGRYQFSLSKYRDKLSNTLKDEYIIKTIEFSKRIADNYKDKKVLDLIKDFNISLIEFDKSNDEVLSCFKSSNKILLFKDNIDKVCVKLNKYGVDLSNEKIEEVCIAYGLYYYLRKYKIQSLLTEEETHEIKKGHQYKMKIDVLSEIAAKSFAKEITQLPFSANVLDFILYTIINQPKAKDMFLKIFELDYDTIDIKNI